MQEVVKEAFLLWFSTESALILPGQTTGQESPQSKYKLQAVLPKLSFSEANFQGP
jgi:hypothetical protein